MQLTEQLLGHELGFSGGTIQQKMGMMVRQLELQIVGHDSCIDCDCSIVETCGDAQQCVGQDDWQISWQ